MEQPDAMRMVSNRPPAADVFAAYPTRTLPRDRVAAIRADYRAGAFSRIFPAGSSDVPALLVGRERQMQQLRALADELLGAPGGRGRSLFGVALHGPRGTGKTALLTAFCEGLKSGGNVRVASWTGEDLGVSSN